MRNGHQEAHFFPYDVYQETVDYLELTDIEQEVTVHNQVFNHYVSQDFLKGVDQESSNSACQFNQRVLPFLDITSADQKECISCEVLYGRLEYLDLSLSCDKAVCIPCEILHKTLCYLDLAEVFCPVHNSCKSFHFCSLGRLHQIDNLCQSHHYQNIGKFGKSYQNSVHHLPFISTPPANQNFDKLLNSKTVSDSLSNESAQGTNSLWSNEGNYYNTQGRIINLSDQF